MALLKKCQVIWLMVFCVHGVLRLRFRPTFDVFCALVCLFHFYQSESNSQDFSFISVAVTAKHTANKTSFQSRNWVTEIFFAVGFSVPVLHPPFLSSSRAFDARNVYKSYAICRRRSTKSHAQYRNLNRPKKIVMPKWVIYWTQRAIPSSAPEWSRCDLD